MSHPSDLANQLRSYGAPTGSVVPLDGPPEPAHVPYLDLVREGTAPEERPHAVVEVQGRPVLFVVRDGHGLQIPRLQRVLALRADGSFLGVLEPGRLTIYANALISAEGRKLREVREDETGASDVIPELALAPPAPRETAEVQSLLFRLFDHATTTIARCGVTPEDALSLAGRAVFLRFLVDRGVVRPDDVQHVCPNASRFEDCFATPTNAAATSGWLDATFNGDLLPLTSVVTTNGEFFAALSTAERDRICATLTTIMLRAEPSRQLRLDWSALNFAHIPVGLLSQVYERHAEMHHTTARATSVYYTPRAIAEYMVDEAFAALASPHTARVLDPAAGAGVFLVAAFRKLVAERWRHDGKQPATATIRRILNQQLAGFEINESALRLCALSLYLTALELDPQPRPVQRLRFDNLRGSVLFDVSDGASLPYVPGSLGPAVGEQHSGRYDLVVGNPPWTPLRRTAASESYRAIVDKSVQAAVAARLGADRATGFTIPDDDPDIAFFWRATEWAKPKAIISLAMHGRLLFKQSLSGRQARASLFQAARITGILNGAAVRQTEVWPRIAAPFCLVFARNERPQLEDTFYFASVELEEPLNRRGRIRLDAKAARPITHGEATRDPYLLKTLFRGSVLDAALMRKLANAPTTLGAYWRASRLEQGDGFIVGKAAQQDASALHGLPVLESAQRLTRYRVRTSALEIFDRPTLNRPRRRELYCAPLVLVPQAPDPTRKSPRASLATRDVVFSQSLIGYSCAGHPRANDLARYLLLLLNSNIPVYIALMTSGQFGVERDVYGVDDLKQMPFKRLEDLSDSQRDTAFSLANELLTNNAVDWRAVDAWAGDIYGLNKWDREVIEDTLRIATPWAQSKAVAQQRPTQAMLKAFVARVAGELRPFLKEMGIVRLDVDIARQRTDEPWIWIAFNAPPDTDGKNLSATALVADDLGATQVFLCGRNTLHIGILAQQRYWTRTRARLLAIDLLQRTDVLRVLKSGNV